MINVREETKVGLGGGRVHQDLFRNRLMGRQCEQGEQMRIELAYCN